MRFFDKQKTIYILKVMENTSKKNNKLFIQGITHNGQKFRPSDWAERLCCSVAIYKPSNYQQNTKNYCLIYSPYATPIMLEGVQYAMIDEKIKELEPLAFEFLINFAKDNNLPVLEGCDIQEQKKI